MSAFSVSIRSNAGGRPENQDCYASKQTTEGLLIIVCDGMGGAAGGKLAAEMACGIVVNQFEKAGGQTADKIVQAIKTANRAIYAKGRAERELQNMGTTIAVLYLEKGQAYFFHLGDTRIYHIRNGHIEKRTADHSHVGEMVRRGILSDEQARLSVESNIISKALGTEPEVEVEITAGISFQQHDRFVVCTDGIWGTLPEEKLISAWSEDRPVEAITASLIEQINTTQYAAGGDHDNMTLALMEVVSSHTRNRSISLSGWFNILLSIALAVSLVFNFRRPDNNTNDKPVEKVKDTTAIKSGKRFPVADSTTKDSIGKVASDAPERPAKKKQPKPQQ
ncbi:MAG: serine/threonine-protein phosphatase [Niastella sp.]|nr:serine/threonine-protein phosphatase [Niastella sp.]